MSHRRIHDYLFNQLIDSRCRPVIVQESREGGSQHGEEDKTSEVESWMKRTFPRYFRVLLVASGFYFRCYTQIYTSR